MCDSCCGQNVDLDREEGAGGPTIARAITLLRMFVRHVGESALTATVWREGEQSRKSGKRDQLDILCFVFFAALQDGGLLEMSCFSSMVPSMVPLANAS